MNYDKSINTCKLQLSINFICSYWRPRLPVWDTQERSCDFPAAQLGNHPTEFEQLEHFMTQSSTVISAINVTIGELYSLVHISISPAWHRDWWVRTRHFNSFGNILQNWLCAALHICPLPLFTSRGGSFSNSTFPTFQHMKANSKFGEKNVNVPKIN